VNAGRNADEFAQLRARANVPDSTRTSVQPDAAPEGNAFSNILAGITDFASDNFRLRGPDEQAAPFAEQVAGLLPEGAADKGLLPAIGESLGDVAFENREIVEAGVEAVKKTATTGTNVVKFLGKHLFGIQEEEAKTVIDGLDPKNSDVAPEQAEQAEQIISNNTANQTAGQRVDSGANSIIEAAKAVGTPTTRNRRPTGKQRAIAATMRANGILGETAYNTYLETGKFSMADIAAAAAVNNSRAALIKEARLTRKFTAAIGDAAAKESKEIFNTVLTAASQTLQQTLVNTPSWNSFKSKNGPENTFDLEKQAQSMMTNMAFHPAVYRGIYGQDNPYKLNANDLSQIQQYLSTEGFKLMNKPRSYTFSDDTEGSTTSANALVNGYKKWQADARQPLRK
jgi:hypothetical protein